MKREAALFIISLLGLLLCASFVRAAQKPDPPLTDPRIAVALKYVRDGATFDLTNQNAIPIVYWTAVFGTRVLGLRAQGPPGFFIPPVGPQIICWGGTGGFDVIEPQEVRHAATFLPAGCDQAPFHLSAIFADGSWTGEWGDLERSVKFWAVRRQTAQQWLVSLREMRTAPDPVAEVGGLMQQLERIREPTTGGSSTDSLWRSLTCPQEPWRGPCPGDKAPERMPPQNSDVRPHSVLLSLVWRCYDHILARDYRPTPKRDKRAENALKSRADATELLEKRIAREIAMVEAEIADTAWLTLLGPNGERVGPDLPPPPPRLESVELWRPGSGPSTKIRKPVVRVSGSQFGGRRLPNP